MGATPLSPEVARTYRCYFDKAIMDINAWRPMDAAARKRDYLYAAVLLSFFIAIPLVVLPVTAAFEKTAAGVIVSLLSWAVGLAVGLSKRRKIIKRFYAVPDAAERTRFIEGEDFDVFLQEHGTSTIAFILEANDLSAGFIYNWLQRHGAIKDGRLDIHCFSADDLARHFPIVFQHPDDTSILCVPFDELVMDADTGARLGHESGSVGARLLAELQ